MSRFLTGLVLVTALVLSSTAVSAQQGDGKAKQGAGKGKQGAGKGMQGAGKGMQGAGKGMQGAGNEADKLEALFKQLDTNADGKLSKDEFKKYGESGQGKPKDNTESTNKLFEKLDSNANGTLNRDEFMKLSELNKEVDKFETLFKKLDANSNGKLSKDEFKKLAELESSVVSYARRAHNNTLGILDGVGKLRGCGEAAL